LLSLVASTVAPAVTVATDDVPTTASGTARRARNRRSRGTLIGAQRLVTGSCENMVRVWQYAPAEASWKQERLVQEQALVHKDWVRDVAWAPFSGMPVNTIASCSEDRSVLIWTQDEAGEGAWTPTLLHTFDSPVWRVSWSTTGNVLAVSSGARASVPAGYTARVHSAPLCRPSVGPLAV
jgi:WD40 repeat protein